MDEVDALQHSIGERRGRVAGCVKIAIPVGLGLFLSKRLTPLLRQHKDLTVELVLRDSPSNLVEDGIDLELRFGPLADSAAIARLIGRTSTALVAAPEYLASSPPLRHPLDLLHHDCIVHPCSPLDTRWFFCNPAEPNKEILVPVKARIAANNAAAVYCATLSGAGVALLPSPWVAEDIRSGRLLSLLSEYSKRLFPIYLLYPSKRLLPPRTEVFISYLSTLMKDEYTMGPQLPTMIA